MPPVIYYLGGILVRATTKAIRDRLIAQGFRKATKGQINSKIPTVTGTENNLISLITRAKNAIKSESPVASGGRNTPRGTNKLGSSGQSAAGRKLGSMRMKNYGKVRGGKGRAEAMAKPPTTGSLKPSPVGKPSTANTKPAPAKVSSPPKSTNKGVTAGATIAGLVAAAAIGKVAYDAYIKNNSPTVTQIKAADKKIKAATKDNSNQPAKEGSLVGTAGTESKRQKARRIPELTAGQPAAKAMVDARYTGSGVPTLTDTQRIKLKKELAEITRKKPVRPKLRPKVVEAEPMSLRSYLNAEIKSRKSTVTKEKAKAKKGDYKSIAEAKKAKSLYYIKDGKPMAAVYKRDLKGL